MHTNRKMCSPGSCLFTEKVLRDEKDVRFVLCFQAEVNNVELNNHAIPPPHIPLLFILSKATFSLPLSTIAHIPIYFIFTVSPSTPFLTPFRYCVSHPILPVKFTPLCLSFLHSLLSFCRIRGDVVGIHIGKV